jgi:hypothetical protein
MSSQLEERFAIVVLSSGRVVRLLGRGYSLALALALVRSAARAPEPDGVPAMVPQWLDLEIEEIMPPA